MGCYDFCWTDQQNSRQVDFQVEYELHDGDVILCGFTARQVAFVAEDGETVLRTLQVTRPTGQKVLVHACQRDQQAMYRLHEEILALEGECEVVAA